MNLPAILESAFVQITLPLMVTFLGAFWGAAFSFNKRIDDLNERLNRFETTVNERLNHFETGVEKRLDSIDQTLKEIHKILVNHGERIARVEERIPPLVHR